MKYDIARLFTELDWKEIKERVEKFDLFEIERSDKTHGIKICIGTRQAKDSGYWQNDFYCFIDGNRSKDGFQGFGNPYNRAEFLCLTYDYIIDRMYSGMGIERQSQLRQQSLFALL